MSESRSERLKELHDRLGSMIDQISYPDHSMRELVRGVRQVRDELFLLSTAPVSEQQPLCGDCKQPMVAEWHCYECGGPTSV